MTTPPGAPPGPPPGDRPLPPPPPPAAPPGPPAAPPGPPPSGRESDRERRARDLRARRHDASDPMARLLKLQEIYDAELITAAEYAAKRAQIIDEI